MTRSRFPVTPRVGTDPTLYRFLEAMRQEVQRLGTSSSTGGATVVILEGGAAFATGIDTLDFDAGDFVLSESPTGELNISFTVPSEDIIQRDGSIPLTADWDTGAFDIQTTELRTDTINEEGAGNGVTIDGLTIKDGAFNEDVLPISDSTLDLGSTGKVWAEVWADAIKTDGDLTLLPSGGDVEVTGDVNISSELVTGSDPGELITNATHDVRFADSVEITGGLLSLASAAPEIDFYETDEGTDDKHWDFNVNLQKFTWRIVNDANDTAVSFMQYIRNGMSITGIVLGASDPSEPITNVTHIIRSPENMLIGGQLTVTGTAPEFNFYETDAGANDKHWDFNVNLGEMNWRVVNDANSAATTWMNARRSGTTLSTVDWTVTTMDLSGTFKVDTINESTGAAGVTIDGLLIKDSGIPEAAVTAHEAALAIGAAQVAGGTLGAGDFHPAGDSNEDLGASGSVWAEGWFDAIKSDGAITITPSAQVNIVGDLDVSSQLAVGSAGAIESKSTFHLADLLNTDATSHMLRATPTFGNQVTTAAYGIKLLLATAVAAFTVTNMYGIHIGQTTKGAGSTITNQYGLYIDNQDDGGTLNYAIYTGTGAVRFGGTEVRVDGGTLYVDTIAEDDADQGVTIDGVLVKDSLINASYISGGTFGAGDFHPAGDSAEDLGATGSVWAEGWFDAIKSDGTITVTPGATVVFAGIVNCDSDASGRLVIPVGADQWAT